MDGLNSRMEETEKRIHELEDKMGQNKIAQSEQQRKIEKKKKRINRISGSCVTITKDRT